MQAFSFPGAVHFCNGFQGLPQVSHQSISDFNLSHLQGIRQINEGTPLYSEYRDCALRDAERSLYMAVSQYRRALDLMIPSSSHWAHVTLYYGSLFAAQAILGMFGCQLFSKHVVEVNQSTPGQQSLRRMRIGNGQNQHSLSRNGSHQRFWEAFYSTMRHIAPFVEPRYSHLLTPISSNEMWLVEQRNRINYRMAEAMAFRNSFATNFSVESFPSSLPAELNTQYQLCEGFMFICSSLANQLGLMTDALASLGPQSTLKDRVRQHVYNAFAPSLVGHTRGRDAFMQY